MKKIIASLFVVAVASGCATSQVQQTSATQATPAPSPLGACGTNFISEGSLFTGKKFSTFQEFPRKTVPAAFDSLLQTVASSGYQIISSSKEAGMISANQSVFFGQGKTVPMNFVIKKINDSGVRVDASFTMSIGLSASEDAVQREFCKLLAAVDTSPDAATPAPAVTPSAASAPTKAVETPAPTPTPKAQKKTRKASS